MLDRVMLTNDDGIDAPGMEVLEEIADAVTRNDRSRTETLVERLETVTARLGLAMSTCLDDIDRRWGGRGTRAA